MRKLIFILFVIIGCKETPNESIKNDEIFDKYYGKTLVLPLNVKGFSLSDSLFMDSVKIYQAPLKIVTLIDGSCSSCIRTLRDWNNFIRTCKVKSSSIGFIIFIDSKSGFETFKWLVRAEKIMEYPVFLDLKHEFSIMNQLVDDKLYNTFLINDKNEIILIGNPISSNEIKELYYKQISLSRLKRR